MKISFHLVATILLATATGESATAQEVTAKTPENIALGAPVSFDKVPNYALSSDPEDKLQLTDGKFVENNFWTQKGTVGWANTIPVITVDLGKEQPIGGVMVRTAAGRASVNWPTLIFLAVSDDGKRWRFVGDLVRLSRQEGRPQPASDRYDTFRYFTHRLKTKGRYVAVVPLQQPYTFVDEVEIYRGDDSFLQTSDGATTVESIQDLVKEERTHALMLNRLSRDLGEVREEWKRAQLSEAIKKELGERLDAVQGELDQIASPDAASFKTTIPQNATHAKILAVHGEILSARLPALTAWKKHRYAWLDLWESPAENPSTPPSLEIEMLGNEVRADSFLLTNASGKDAAVTLEILAPPASAKEGWLQVSALEWTDTQQNNPVAAALSMLEPAGGAYPVSIPAGLTRKIWLSVDSSRLSAGTHQTSIRVQGNGETLTLPLTVSVSTLPMGRPRLSLGMWDYTNTNFGALTTQNREAAIRMMRSHYVDSPWANSAVLPWPQATDFDGNHQWKEGGKLAWKAFDDWVALWPDARRYLVFASVGAGFAGAKPDSEQFNGRVGTWAKALSGHMRDLGLRPEQLGLLLVDEPHTEEQDAVIAAWARSINAAAPELTLFQDPTWQEPHKTKIQEAITSVDIVSPLIMFHKAGGEPVRKYFQERRAAGQTLWFYQCQGPVRLFSPGRYHRLQSWYAFNEGATGLGNWAFADTGGVASSWNEYLCSHNNYSPVFLQPSGIISGIHWEAVREGVQDYETFAMLRDAAAKSEDATLREKATALLKEIGSVNDTWVSEYEWTRPEDPQWADDRRSEAFALLESLCK